MTSTVQDFAMRFVGGHLEEVHGTERVPVINPFTEQQIGRIPDSDAQDVDAAVTAARAASASWSKTSPADRAGYIRALADAIDRRAPELSAQVARQNGVPYQQSIWANSIYPNQVYR